MKINSLIKYKGQLYLTKDYLAKGQVLAENIESGAFETISEEDLISADAQSNAEIIPIESLSDKNLQTAVDRFNIIKPLLDHGSSTEKIQELSAIHNRHQATIYRWIQDYKKTGMLSSLAPKAYGGKGKSRLGEEKDKVIQDVINRIYLKQGSSISEVYREIEHACLKQQLKPPGINTVRNRIDAISEKKKVKNRKGKKEADDQFNPKSKAPEVSYPLECVQIDHTTLDIILVDNVNRRAIGRPYITLVFDVYSRMVLGFYISFEPPSTLTVGQAIAHSIIPKEYSLANLGLSSEWPCQGIPAKIHMDNAKEFRSYSLSMSCQQYGIDIEYRPVKHPEYGGHVERVLKTYAHEIHELPGTTKSNINERGNYDSEGNATLSLQEFELWFHELVLEHYHKKVHSTLKMTPLKKWYLGINGDDDKVGLGLQKVELDELRVKLDFLPAFKRTVQQYGVQIDHLTYWDNVLLPYIHTLEGYTKKSRKKKEYYFKRDPRDISKLYFLHPEENEYFIIPFRDRGKGPITIWEWRAAMADTKKNEEEVDEDMIYNSWLRRKRIIEEAQKKTKSKRKKAKKTVKPSVETEFKEKTETKKSDKVERKLSFDPSSILPFDERK